MDWVDLRLLALQIWCSLSYSFQGIFFLFRERALCSREVPNAPEIPTKAAAMASETLLYISIVVISRSAFNITPRLRSEFGGGRKHDCELSVLLKGANQL